MWEENKCIGFWQKKPEGGNHMENLDINES